MDEIRKLEKLGIDKEFSIDQITKIIGQNENKKQKDKSLSNKTAWINQNIYLGENSIITTTINPKQKTKITIKYKIPPNQQNDYNDYIEQHIVHLKQQLPYNKLIVNDKLNLIIDYLKYQNPPRYLTTLMKKCIKKMIKNGDSDEEIFEYLVKNDSEIPFSVINPITIKLEEEEKQKS